MKGHTYIYIDTCPFQAWLHKIGTIDSPKCPCGAAVQNAAHITTCELVSRGESRSAEDMEFCSAVPHFLWEKPEVTQEGGVRLEEAGTEKERSR